MQLSAPQKHLGARGFLACVLVIGTLLIFAIDLYVPALPVMQRELGVSASFLNLTMFAFFFFGAFGVLLGGPISDRLGRKRPYLASIALFAVASFGCMLAGGVWELVAFRSLQALAFGVEAAIRTALVKDAYEGESLKLAMTLVQSLMIVGPALAPFLGSFLVLALGWRGVFGFLAVAGVVSLCLASLMSETLGSEHRLQGGVLDSFRGTLGNTRALLSQRGFTALALIMGVIAVPYFAWIATVSYIMVDFFQADYLVYSLVYAATSAVSIVAPYVYIVLSKRMGVRQLVVLCIALGALSTALLAAWGASGPLAFAIAFVPFALAEGIMRPMAYVVLLDQPPRLVGAASSFTNFLYNVITALATVLATLPWASYVTGLAVLGACSVALIVVLYLWGVRGASLSFNPESEQERD